MATSPINSSSSGNTKKSDFAAAKSLAPKLTVRVDTADRRPIGRHADSVFGGIFRHRRDIFAVECGDIFRRRRWSMMSLSLTVNGISDQYKPAQGTLSHIRVSRL